MITVLNIAYPFAPVRDDTAGGAEQAVLSIDAGLFKYGFRSIVVACAGSRVKGRLFEVPSVKGGLDEGSMSLVRRIVKETAERALEEEKVDVVHMHGIDFFRYVPGTSAPVLATLHLPVSWYPEDTLLSLKGRVNYNFVSGPQRDSAPGPLRGFPVVENGVDIDALKPRVSRRGYALCLGRVCPEKGFHLALQAARKASIPLVIAGGVAEFDSHKKYFEDRISPALGNGVRFIGEAGPIRKRRLLAGARCLLVPSLVEETSSLAAMEALACGTPVVAFRKGALPELIEDGKTGFLVEGVDEMAEAIKKAGALDRAECVRAAGGFSADSMTEKYIRLYAELMGA